MAKRDYKRKEPVEFIDEQRQPWDRQERESEKAWQSFQLYRDALLPGGIGERTQRAVCARLYPNASPTTGRVKEVGVWSVKWRWVERCNAYDVHLDRLKQDEFREALKRDTELNIASYRAMRSKGGRAIALAQPENINARDAARMVDMAITGLRREAGLATEISATEKDSAFVAWLTAGDDDEDEP